MTAPAHRSAVRAGWFHRHGRAEPLITADYPYYRDDPANWLDRLAALADLGVHAVTCYLPWRHHQPTPLGEPDLTGETDPARDVLGFLQLVATTGLCAVVKPGPFVHAEINYGGLPDWVCPVRDPRIEPVRDAEGTPRTWSGSVAGADGAAEDWPLPAPLGPAFDELVLRWLRAVGRRVVAPLAAPHGPIIAVQVGNEGIYTDGALGLLELDFSDSARAAHARLHAPIGEGGPPVAGPGETDPSRRISWAASQAEGFAEVFRRWATTVGAAVPAVVNLNPPAEGPGALDSWLARVQPWRWGGVRYGFTNWIGLVAESAESRARYVIAAKLAPGANLEENWGFSVLYEKAFADPTTCLHQTVLALACGATGYNLYTGVATASWPAELDRFHDRPYPDAAPIAPDGSATEKAAVARALARYLRKHGAEWAAAQPDRRIVLAYHPAHAAAASTEGEADPPVPPCGEFLRGWHDAARTAGVDYALWDLGDPAADPLQRLGVDCAQEEVVVVMPSWRYLSRHAQLVLAGHLAAGGRLVLAGQAPELDAEGAVCRLLAEAIGRARADQVFDLTGVPLARAVTEAARQAATWAPPAARVVGGAGDVFLRRAPRGVIHLAVLTPRGGEGGLRIRLAGAEGSETIQLAICDGGAALLRLQHGKVTSALVAGRNRHLGCAVTPMIAAGGVRLAARYGELLDITVAC